MLILCCFLGDPLGLAGQRKQQIVKNLLFYAKTSAEHDRSIVYLVDELGVLGIYSRFSRLLKI